MLRDITSRLSNASGDVVIVAIVVVAIVDFMRLEATVLGPSGGPDVCSIVDGFVDVCEACDNFYSLCAYTTVLTAMSNPLQQQQQQEQQDTTLTQRRSEQQAHSASSSATTTSIASHQQQQQQPERFSMVRSFHLADFITLANGVCGATSVLLSAKYLVTRNDWYLWTAIYLLPLGALFDVFDGRVARWRRSASLLGQELDSLADLISFGLAPAMLGFAVGFQTSLDIAALVYFVCCGIARLARYNATVASIPKESDGKIKFFEGTPIPTSLIIVVVVAYWLKQGLVFNALYGGEVFVIGSLSIHPAVLVYAASGTAMVSKRLRIPKL
ncbi:CDP-diacylglycerol--serine O-phosphatidyltransferase [Ramicandelaber brevisporus]|nr:CDP-diacylglycerol--serine O-phosphatidyltransferase [Ramicandelaber brevisporus]